MKSYDCKACKVSADRSIFLTRLFKKLTRGGKEQTARAAVFAKDMAMARFPTPESTWDYLVTFILEDGTQVQLHTLQVQYEDLALGMAGQLCWEGETFLDFTKEEG